MPSRSDEVDEYEIGHLDFARLQSTFNRVDNRDPVSLTAEQPSEESDARLIVVGYENVGVMDHGPTKLLEDGF